MRPILERHCGEDVNVRHPHGRGPWRRHEARSKGGIGGCFRGGVQGEDVRLGMAVCQAGHVEKSRMHGGAALQGWESIYM